MRGPKVLASGRLERIGEQSSSLSHSSLSHSSAGSADPESVEQVKVVGHRDGMQLIARHLAEHGILADSETSFGIGHRVVHGGKSFRQPTLIDDRVLEVIRAQIPLAPLLNPGNIAGIEVALDAFQDVPQVAVFDTAFHQDIPEKAFRYALPDDYYTRLHVRRYGFHGTSHSFIAKRAAEWLGRPAEGVNLITLHLGNGASAAAIRQGHCVDTSMGMTPLEGLIMGTRSGDIDPAILLYLARAGSHSMDQLDDLLNRKSGLKGICGVNDMREVLELADGGDRPARLAVDMYAYRVRKYIGAYMAVLGQVDAIVFSAGIGENVAEIRQLTCEGLESLGIAIDLQRNSADDQGVREIHRPESDVRILIVPTDEELEIASQTVRCIQAGIAPPQSDDFSYD